jgi:LmbE family N-acetylglucosaminyl deacetylase
MGLTACARDVITHNIANGNPEHCAASHLTTSAFRQAAGKAGLKELWMTCRVQSPSDILFLSPDVLVDIAKYPEMKLDALRALENIGEIAGC